MRKSADDKVLKKDEVQRGGRSRSRGPPRRTNWC